MIRLERPSKVPGVLESQGSEATRANCELFDAAPESYRKGRSTFRFRRNVYAHQTVKGALLTAQHGKCCYCEAKFSATSYGVIEHFRPKGAVRRTVGGPLEHPGYYWLAYRWDNLLVSCERCNTSHKREFFPLNGGAAARSHHDSVEAEEPMLLNPFTDAPEEHIRFVNEEVYGVTVRGRETIRGVGLRRHALQEARRGRCALLRGWLAILSLEEEFSPELVDEAREWLREFLSSESEFSGMARDFLDSKGMPRSGA